MRQGNSNKRMRGRGGGGGGGNGRKSPNPLSRSYESAGPENTKIRGTALHVAEKYVSLARDAQSSGDPVLAENFLQHAEHYYRIIAAAQASMPQPTPIVRSDIQTEEDDEDFDENGEARPTGSDDGFMPADAPQPFLDDVSGETRGDRQPRDDRRDRNRGGRNFRNGPRGDRPEGGRDGNREGNRFEGDRRPRGDRPVREPRDEGEGDLSALPAFLTGGSGRPLPVAEAPQPAVAVADVEGDDDAPRRRTRGGRGRGRRPAYEGGEGIADASPAEPVGE